MGWRESWKRGMYNPALSLPRPPPPHPLRTPPPQAKTKETRESGASNGRGQGPSMDPRRHKDMHAIWYQINAFLGTQHASGDHYELIGMWWAPLLLQLGILIACLIIVRKFNTSQFLHGCMLSSWQPTFSDGCKSPHHTICGICDSSSND